MKTCRACGLYKPLDEFHRQNKGNRDGRQSVCKPCAIEGVKQWQKDNRLKLNATHRARVHGPKHDEILAKARAYARAHPFRDMSPERKAVISAISRRNRFKKSYGITPEQYDEMAAAQGGACRICGRLAAPDPRKGLYVDHDHSTGRVRGLLCSQCNTALGLLNDDVALLAGAIEYLKAQYQRRKG